MSDLSASFLPATALANGSPALRGNDASTQADAAPKNGEGSFSSVLTDKVSKTKEVTPDKTTTARPSAQEKPQESTPSQAAASEQTTASAPANEVLADSEAPSQTIAANSPIATVLLQLLPRAAVINDGAVNEQGTSAVTGTEALDATETQASTEAGLTPADIGLSLAIPGFHPLGNAATTPKEAAPALTPQAIISSDSAGTEASALGLTESSTVAASAGVEQQTAFSAGAETGDSAITAETRTTLAGEPARNDENSFSQLLGRAQDASGQTSATPIRGANAAENTAHMQHAAGHPNWSNELGDKLTWMVTTQKQQAELVLNPPQLGRIEVSLTVSGDQANAVFTSPNAAVRELIENSLPRLREILAGSGLNLGQADVGAQSFSQQRGDQTADNRQGSNGRGSFIDGLPGLHEIASGTGSMNLGRPGERQGMVDIFA